MNNEETIKLIKTKVIADNTGVYQRKVREYLTNPEGLRRITPYEAKQISNELTRLALEAVKLAKVVRDNANKRMHV